MSQFEYLAISVAILISIAVARMISGLPHALSGARRYLLHYGWIIVWLWGIVMSWWGIWNYRELEWTFVRFLLFLSPSGPVLFIAYTLVPDNPERVESWKEYFYAVRPPLFVASMLFYVVLLLNQSVLEFIPILDFRRLVPTLLLSAALVGFASRSPRAQGIVLGFNIAVFVALFASIVLRPFVD
jgi:hypothetical protein